MIYNNHKYKVRRKELRNKATKHEVVLWKILKNSNLGYKFRRQHGIGPYIVDFYQSDKKLVIELDGYFHIGDKGYDSIRDAYLNGLGHTIMRFSNNELEEDTSAVRNKIAQWLGLPPPVKEGVRGWY